MRPHPRIRKTIMWGGAALTALLVVVWIGSRWVWFGYFAPSWRVEIGYGQLRATRLFSGNPWASPGPGPFCKLAETNDYWLWFWLETTPAVLQDAGIPLWAPASLTLGMAAFAWRLDTRARRRADRTRCFRCGYDRTGLAVGAVCPECGSAAPDARS